jgi:hypothetical protein
MIRKINTSLLAVLMLTTIFAHTTIANNKISQCKSHKTTLYFGSFCNMPITNFSILYDGEIIDIQEAFFTIKDKLLGSINFLFVDLEKIKFCLEENTVQEIVLKTQDYKFFQLNITQFPSPSDLKNSCSSSWKIKEKTINKQVPLNTIIIPISPSLINIELQNIVCKPSNLAIRLPSIKLTAKTNKSLKSLMLESYLKTISLKPFYVKQRVKSINQQSMKISLIV